MDIIPFFFGFVVAITIGLLIRRKFYPTEHEKGVDYLKNRKKLDAAPDKFKKIHGGQSKQEYIERNIG